MSCKPTRREFIQITGTASALLATGSNFETAIAGPFEPKDIADHFVPVDKKLKPEWVKTLFEKGGPTWYSGSDLATIGMPICGITTGQLYLAGDGRLAHWDIFNLTRQANRAYDLGRRLNFPVQQGFAVQVKAGGKTETRTLDANGFPGVRFCGEYPLGFVEYKDEALPVKISLDAYSPFIPLNAADSALPVTLMQFSVKNTSSAPAEVALAGWLENAVCSINGEVMLGSRINRAASKEGLSLIESTAKSSEPPKSAREPIVIADFEGGDYGKWKAEGPAFGTKPAEGALPGQQPVTGFKGKALVNSFLDGDASRGKLTSPTFKIERSFINFLIGGGRHPRRTCINLLVGGKIVRMRTGQDDEHLTAGCWNVREFEGQEAQIEILDRQAGAWGHVNVDQIEMADLPPKNMQGSQDKFPDFGSMALALLGTADGTFFQTSLPEEKTVDALFGKPTGESEAKAEKSLEKTLIGGLGKRVQLAAGQETKLTFVVAWHFPNRPKHGNFYTNRFADAAAVAEYVAKNYPRLDGETRLWHKTWYDSTLPHWLLDRLFSTTSILATGTCQWWANGRFWAWEGVACCEGTCGHVWNYEHAMARLFPELERSVREMQDYESEAGFDVATGAIRFRGERGFWAGDSQPGYVLKSYREHQMSPDSEFLKRLWLRIRKSMEFMMVRDGNADGLVEGEQHNTYDINFYGPNTMVGSLYLAALRAAEEMAREMGDVPFAEQCRKIYERGRENTVKELYNGEYFVQKVDLEKYPRFQYADGCLADHLFGDGWARQVGLENVYPAETVRSALKAIWTYNWAPDIAPQNKAHPPERWFARPGEAGLFICTWPKSKHLGRESVRYRDEVWTGIEYQVAGNMAWEGMLTEALAICRAVHERYHPAKYNPWNEIECGDHYSRAMASYGVFLGLGGYEYHGPKQLLGFAPKITPENFRSAFTTAEGWGTFTQKREGDVQTERIAVLWGKLPLKMLKFELPEGKTLQKTTVTAAGKPVAGEIQVDGRNVRVTLPEPVVLKANEELTVELR